MQKTIHAILQDLASKDLLGDSAGHRIAARLAAAAGNLCATPNGCRHCTVGCRDDFAPTRL
ncbi:hypothetical protein [Roseiterribacter gracilis]|uniref:hypothetical protein n=1 Tax=Roseiterribacter gracilis TaxID=2812848 RepID=UPI003B43B76A